MSDDIAILTLATPIYANGDTIKYAKLPDNGDNLFVNQSGIITGWGRTGEKLPISFSSMALFRQALFRQALFRHWQVLT